MLLDGGLRLRHPNLLLLPLPLANITLSFRERARSALTVDGRERREGGSTWDLCACYLAEHKAALSRWDLEHIWNRLSNLQCVSRPYSLGRRFLLTSASQIHFASEINLKSCTWRCSSISPFSLVLLKTWIQHYPTTLRTLVFEPLMTTYCKVDHFIVMAVFTLAQLILQLIHWYFTVGHFALNAICWTASPIWIQGAHLVKFLCLSLNELVSPQNYKNAILTVTQCQRDIISKDRSLNCTAGCR